MRGAAVVLVCAFALINGARIDIKIISNEDTETEDVVVNSDPSEAQAICAAEDSDGVLVANEYCNWYYACAGGAPVSMKCPDNLLYNYNTEECDWVENVDCGDRVISEEEDNTEEEEAEIEDSVTVGNGTNSDPSEAPAICAAEESDGVLVAHEYCNYFYICSSYQPVSIKCPLNLVYNYQNEYCDWQNNVDCGDRVMYEEEVTTESASDSEESTEVESDGGNSDPSQATAICASADSDGILVASENCNQFYNCWDGVPMTLVCPTNLVFNPARNYCDWPQNVDCGDRVVE